MVSCKVSLKPSQTNPLKCILSVLALHSNAAILVHSKSAPQSLLPTGINQPSWKIITHWNLSQDSEWVTVSRINSCITHLNYSSKCVSIFVHPPWTSLQHLRLSSPAKNLVIYTERGGGFGPLQTWSMGSWQDFSCVLTKPMDDLLANNRKGWEYVQQLGLSLDIDGVEHPAW